MDIYVYDPHKRDEKKNRQKGRIYCVGTYKYFEFRNVGIAKQEQSWEKIVRSKMGVNQDFVMPTEIRSRLLS